MKSSETRGYNPLPWLGHAKIPYIIEFGRFKVVRHRRELLADGRPVELGGRAFDTLLALIDARGSVLGKDELMSRVWPDRVVEENNLPAQISVLRKVFGADRDLIRTVAGRGYQFTGEIRATAATAAGPPPSRTTNLPEAVSELIGREAELGEVTALVTEHRLVSLVGAGGIGKTRLGLEVARHLLPRFPDGVFVAELGPLSSPELVPATVASALGLTHVAGTVSHERVAGAVGTKKLLLVIDNCEHVIEAAAGMAEALLRASPGVSLLATSREPLRVSGEYVYRVPPLDVPAEDNQDTEDVFRYGAVRLFVSRAHAAEPRYVAEGRVAAATAAICRRLDGIPLAIELAATRIVGVRCRWRGRPPGRPLQTAHRRQAHGAAPSPDDARDARLELRAAVRIRAGGPAPVGGLRRGLSRWTQPVPSRRASTSPRRRSRIRSRTWWASHSCRRMSAARSCTIACSRRRAPTRARSSSRAPNSTTSRDATPSTIETSSSMPRPS